MDKKEKSLNVRAMATPLIRSRHEHQLTLSQQEAVLDRPTRMPLAVAAALPYNIVKSPHGSEDG